MTEIFDPSVVGTWSEPWRYHVEPEVIAAYARATNDTSPAALAGEVAPPVFAIVPLFGGGGVPVVRAEFRTGIVGQVVHGEQWFRFEQDIHGGDELELRSMPIGIHAKASGVTAISKTETRNSRGIVNEQYVTIFYRAVASAVDIGEGAPTLGTIVSIEEGTPVAEISYRIDADQPARYAEASGDHNRIHVDEEFARSAGYPGVIVHGMCALAFAARALDAAFGDVAFALGELGCRFSRPLLPGGDFVTSSFDLGRVGEQARRRFECRDGDGQVVLSNGYASFHLRQAGEQRDGELDRHS